MPDDSYYIYIVTNKMHTVLYTGIIDDLKRRIFDHKEHFVDNFTRRYKANKVIYYECSDGKESALFRENK
jgi:putative endonuclease